jgi:hypothetical protein
MLTIISWKIHTLLFPFTCAKVSIVKKINFFSLENDIFKSKIGARAA